MRLIYSTGLLFALTLMNASGPAAAQTPLCPTADADAAERLVDTINSWDDVATMYDRYRHCDEGSIAEGNAEAVARILVHRWDTLPQLAALSASKPSLAAFVIKHVDQTLASDDLAQIAKLSASACPHGLADLCRRLHEAAVATR